jgi:hypothetical protein
MKLKRWAGLMVTVYFLLLAILIGPLAILAWAKWSGGAPGLTFDLKFSDVLDVYREWGFWAWLAVLTAAQALMLLVPLDLSERRLTPRVSLLVPISTTAVLLANLFFAGLLCLTIAVFSDKVLDSISALGSQLVKNPVSTKLFANSGITGTGTGDTFTFLIGFFQLLGVFWLIWGFIFYMACRQDEAGSLVRRSTRWMLRGSILELLVAVPSHVVVRNRGDCCAPFGTFWGIVTGLAVMLISFGPGVLFLFAARMRTLKPKPASSRPDELQPVG